MSEKIVQLNEEVIKGQIKELVRGSVEDVYKRQVYTFHRGSGSIAEKGYDAKCTCPIWLALTSCLLYTSRCV